MAGLLLQLVAGPRRQLGGRNPRIQILPRVPSTRALRSAWSCARPSTRARPRRQSSPVFSFLRRSRAQALPSTRDSTMDAVEQVASPLQLSLDCVGYAGPDGPDPSTRPTNAVERTRPIAKKLTDAVERRRYLVIRDSVVQASTRRVVGSVENRASPSTRARLRMQSRACSITKFQPWSWRRLQLALDYGGSRELQQWCTRHPHTRPFNSSSGRGREELQLALDYGRGGRVRILPAGLQLSLNLQLALQLGCSRRRSRTALVPTLQLVPGCEGKSGARPNCECSSWVRRLQLAPGCAHAAEAELTNVAHLVGYDASTRDLRPAYGSPAANTQHGFNSSSIHQGVARFDDPAPSTRARLRDAVELGIAASVWLSPNLQLALTPDAVERSFVVHTRNPSTRAPNTKRMEVERQPPCRRL